MNSTVVYVLSIILYLFIFILRKKMKFLTYHVFISMIYLLSVSFIQTLDVTLIFYSFFSIFPYLNKVKINNKFDFFLILYFIFILVISTVMNGKEALSVFAVRTIGMFSFLLVFNNINFENELKSVSTKSIILILFLIAFFELILTIVVLYLSGWSGRLMLNFQCPVGNLSMIGILFSAFAFVNLTKRHRKYIFLFDVFFVLISIISGTRGYVVVCFGMTVLLLFLYIPKKFKAISLLVLILLVISFNSYLFDLTNSILRVDEGTGRRDLENMFVWNFVPNNTIFGFIFGYGFGTQVSSISGSHEYVSQIATSSYLYNTLLGVTGFHNFFATIFYSSGLIGIAFVIIFFIKLILRVLFSNHDSFMKISIICYILLYIILLWYRWSATSGIIEFALIALLIGNSSEKMEYLYSNEKFEQELYI